MDGSPDDDQSPNSRQRNQKRQRQWSLEDRAKHRVLERERREAFNDRLMELATLLPKLEGVPESRLSKHVIVEESVKHHREQQRQLDESVRRCEELQRERDQLLAEARSWRQGPAHADPIQQASVPMAPVDAFYALPNALHGNAVSFFPGLSTHDPSFATNAIAVRHSLVSAPEPPLPELTLSGTYEGSSPLDWAGENIAWPAYAPSDAVPSDMDWLQPSHNMISVDGNWMSGSVNNRPLQEANTLDHWNGYPMHTSFATA
ncbi:hypothetical protein B0A48_10837 [Cryoendolithus antarcticus]|uniref:BHLH domain-containing protein n=1 Tax=Cryoendolithus antarcticus TaxID=1507870 RepID=A0A1V8SYI7_9PEZI|nr:hypothetical protein B0A48_10837 [Cryoendolithus antarcticus]